MANRQIDSGVNKQHVLLNTTARPLEQQRLRKAFLQRALLFTVAVAIVTIIVFPYYWMIASSLQGKSVFQWPPEIIPGTVTLSAYQRVFEKYTVALWFRNSFVVSTMTALLSAAISINAGYALSRFRTRINSLFGLVVLLTQMLPATLLVIPFYVIFRELKLINNLLGVILANTTFALPLSIWLMKGFFDSIPADLEEQAQVDGCRRVGAFYRITLPLALPGLVVVAVFAFMISWDEFFFARTLISSQDLWVLSVGLNSFQGQYTVEWNEMMAAAVVFTIPAALFFLLIQRYLIRGLTGGAVKG